MVVIQVMERVMGGIEVADKWHTKGIRGGPIVHAIQALLFARRVALVLSALVWHGG